MNDNLPLVLTYGMGIGPEVSLKALEKLDVHPPVILVGRESNSLIRDANFPIWSETEFNRVSWLPLGDSKNEPAEVSAIRWGAQLCLDGKASALVTGPINKAKLIASGFQFHGHTEFLGHICGDVRTVMGFVGGAFRVCLATTHVPLMDVSRHLSIESIVETAEIAWRALTVDLKIQSPKLGICGLNPHAGEDGVLGREEIDVIEPACAFLRAKGYSVVGPISAETAFLMARGGQLDMIMAMYHDQGLAPLKAVDFGESVNWTLGLPIIRTSVDHGTAESLVGKGIARCDSMCAAIELACFLAGRNTW